MNRLAQRDLGAITEDTVEARSVYKPVTSAATPAIRVVSDNFLLYWPKIYVVDLNLRERVPPGQDPEALHIALQTAVSQVRTDLDSFGRLESLALIRHGYSVARKALLLAKYPLLGSIMSPGDPFSAWEPKALIDKAQAHDRPALGRE